MKRISILILLLFIGINMIGQNSNKLYVYNLLIDCKSAIKDSDFKIFLCNNNEKISRLNEIYVLRNNALYYISYNYNSNYQRIPSDTLIFNINDYQTDTIFSFLKNIFFINEVSLTYEKKKYGPVNMYDGLTSEIILDLYYYNRIFKKENSNKDEELLKFLSYLSSILNIKIDYY